MGEFNNDGESSPSPSPSHQKHRKFKKSINDLKLLTLKPNQIKLVISPK